MERPQQQDIDVAWVLDYKVKDTDVDIDFADRDSLLSVHQHICARINRKDGYEKHNTGVYFQPVPANPLTNVSNIDHTETATLGYFKIDCLNNSIYKGVRDEAHLNELLNREPEWDLLNHSEIVEKLYHINQYADLVRSMQPRSVEELAMLLAVIRPGKAHLRNQPWDKVRKDVWVKPTDDSYYFKKSHSVAFALAIVVQLNLMVEEAMK